MTRCHCLLIQGCILAALFFLTGSCAENSATATLDVHTRNVKLTDAEIVSSTSFSDSVQILPLLLAEPIGEIADMQLHNGRIYFFDDLASALVSTLPDGTDVRKIKAAPNAPQIFDDLTGFTVLKDTIFAIDGPFVYLYDTAFHFIKSFKSSDIDPDNLFTSCNDFYSYSGGTPGIYNRSFPKALIYKINTGFEVSQHYLPIYKHLSQNALQQSEFVFNKQDTTFILINYTQTLYYKTCENEQFVPYIDFDGYAYTFEQLQNSNHPNPIEQMSKAQPDLYMFLRVKSITDNYILLTGLRAGGFDTLLINRSSGEVKLIEQKMNNYNSLLQFFSMVAPSAQHEGHIYSLISSDHIELLESEADFPASMTDSKHLNYLLKLKLNIL